MKGIEVSQEDGVILVRVNRLETEAAKVRIEITDEGYFFEFPTEPRFLPLVTGING
jgi:hypothetical protein